MRRQAYPGRLPRTTSRMTIPAPSPVGEDERDRILHGALDARLAELDGLAERVRNGHVEKLIAALLPEWRVRYPVLQRLGYIFPRNVPSEEPTE